MGLAFKWLGHSAFLFDIDGHQVLIDPFLTGNPLAAADPEMVTPEIILLSHAHGDHLGDTLDIALRTGATVISNWEISDWLLNKGVRDAIQMNTGGSFDAGFFTVKLTIAFHSSSFPDGSYGGSPHGFLITLPDNGYKIYYAGDTALYSDMQLIGAEGIDLAFLPIGDHFTMGVRDSIQAIQWLKPRLVAPMHYNTFPPIVQNVAEWAKLVNNHTDATPIVLDPGGEYTVI
ncbi:MAG: metal-dependent hydrolase [Armatimonadetes bacterium]|nr:metal-dependent hydrolase [Anaerolineae bacterium]